MIEHWSISRDNTHRPDYSEHINFSTREWDGFLHPVQTPCHWSDIHIDRRTEAWGPAEQLVSHLHDDDLIYMISMQRRKKEILVCINMYIENFFFFRKSWSRISLSLCKHTLLFFFKLMFTHTDSPNSFIPIKGSLNFSHLLWINHKKKKQKLLFHIF